MPKNAPSKTQQVKLKIADYVLSYIRQHKLSEDDRLPSENALAAQFGVDRNVVRGALDHLRSQGRIYACKGKGFFVAEKQLYVVYPQTPTVGFSEAFQNPSYNYQSSLLQWSLVKASAAKCKALDLDEGEELYRLKVLRSVGGLPLALCYSEIPEKLTPYLEKYLDDFYSVNHILTKCYGYTHPICKTLTVEVIMPTAEETELLAITKGVPLMQQISVFEAPGTGPIEYFIVRARSDRYKLNVCF